MRARIALVVALLLLGVSAAGQAQRPAHRYFVDSVADSTIVFHVSGEHGWVRPGHVGIAVDPRRRDALVARFRVLSVDRHRVVALVTGQTTMLTPEHVALLDEPRRRFYRTRGFWAGTFLGAIIGAVAGLTL